MGRPRKNGERFPSGKLKSNKPNVEPMSGVLWQRLKTHGKQLSLDPRLTTELGRLNWFGELTVAQTAAGHRIAEIYGRFERYKKLSRSTRSPSYNASYGEAGVAEELLGEDALAIREDRIRDAADAFIALNGETHEGYHARFGVWIPPVHEPGLIPLRLRSSVERLCVEDLSISPVLYSEIRALLEMLAIRWKIHAAPKAAASSGIAKTMSRHGPSLHFNKHMDEPPAGAAAGADEKPKPNLDRIFMIEVMRKLRPDLDDKALAMAWDIQQALKAREIFRRAKERKQGANVVPFRST